MSGLLENVRWILSTEGDCLLAYKKGKTMWLKAYPTTHGYTQSGPAIDLSKSCFIRATRVIGEELYTRQYLPHSRRQNGFLSLAIMT